MKQPVLENGAHQAAYRQGIDGFPKTVAEYFAGIGLMRLGLERAGWSIEFANDIDPLKREMYSSNFRDTDEHFKLGDIHALNPKILPQTTLATASFPCTDLSLAGARVGLSGPQSSAFWGFIDILKGMGKKRPLLVLIENVTGFLTSSNGSDFKAALEALNALGYAVDAFVVDASRFVPQSRQRIFVVGTLCQSNIAESPRSLGFFESEIRPKALADFIFNNSHIVWKIRTLPKLPVLKEKLESVVEPLADSDPDWWNTDRVEYLLSQMSDRHSATAEAMRAHKKWTYGTVFRRVRNGKSMAELRTDGIAGCLRTPKGGSGRQILFKAGYGRVMVRLLNGRECARLMGADDFVIDAPLNQTLFGFGDAVCVPVVTWIALNYLNGVLEELQVVAQSADAPASIT